MSTKRSVIPSQSNLSFKVSLLKVIIKAEVVDVNIPETSNII